jgi:hypothetical protein
MGVYKTATHAGKRDQEGQRNTALIVFTLSKIPCPSLTNITLKSYSSNLKTEAAGSSKQLPGDNTLQGHAVA